MSTLKSGRGSPGGAAAVSTARDNPAEKLEAPPRDDHDDDHVKPEWLEFV